MMATFFLHVLLLCIVAEPVLAQEGSAYGLDTTATLVPPSAPPSTSCEVVGISCHWFAAFTFLAFWCVATLVCILYRCIYKIERTMEGLVAAEDEEYGIAKGKWETHIRRKQELDTKRRGSVFQQIVEGAINVVEKATGLDLDQDGDVGQYGRENPSGYGGAKGDALDAMEAVTGQDPDQDGDVGIAGIGGSQGAKSANAGPLGKTESSIRSDANEGMLDTLEALTGHDLDHDGDIGIVGSQGKSSKSGCSDMASGNAAACITSEAVVLQVNGSDHRSNQDGDKGGPELDKAPLSSGPVIEAGGPGPQELNSQNEQGPATGTPACSDRRVSFESQIQPSALRSEADSGKGAIVQSATGFVTSHTAGSDSPPPAPLREPGSAQRPHRPKACCTERAVPPTALPPLAPSPLRTTSLEIPAEQLGPSVVSSASGLCPSARAGSRGHGEQTDRSPMAGAAQHVAERSPASTSGSPVLRSSPGARVMVSAPCERTCSTTRTVSASEGPASANAMPSTQASTDRLVAITDSVHQTLQAWSNYLNAVTADVQLEEPPSLPARNGMMARGAYLGSLAGTPERSPPRTCSRETHLAPGYWRPMPKGYFQWTPTSVDAVHERLDVANVCTHTPASVSITQKDDFSWAGAVPAAHLLEPGSGADRRASRPWRPPRAAGPAAHRKLQLANSPPRPAAVARTSIAHDTVQSL